MTLLASQTGLEVIWLLHLLALVAQQCLHQWHLVLTLTHRQHLECNAMEVQEVESQGGE